jgi:AcrR family transcriptional regulator
VRSDRRGEPADESGIGRRRATAQHEGNPTYRAKRSEMIKAAALLFTQKGFEATTLTDIAEASGTERATLYYYFASKEEVLREAVGDVSQRNLDMVERVRASSLGAEERIALFVENTMRSYDENYPQVFLYIQQDMTKVGATSDEWARTMVRQSRAFEDALLGLIRDGVEDGTFRADLEVEIVAKSLWGMLNWTHRWHRPGQTEPDAIARTFVTIFLRGALVRD